MAVLNLLRRPTKLRTSAARALDHARQAARAPELYGEGRIPDTLDGRFESMVLHVALLLERLRGEGKDAAALSQEIFDQLFREFDAALREMAVGDLTVPKRIRRMGDAAYGRFRAYRDALASDDSDALADTLARNVFATGAPDPTFLAAFAGYVRASHASLAEQSATALMAGERPAWGPLRA